ncbi:prenyltransferase [Enterococcus sp. 669A]|uniref:Prenyltransferase n=1 Tax=Candidatus Enterococcus moelleringii TaxID=2815325 RepID=A0ABS3LEX4_9ENTE|nr:prenyltransferase [Enterococcus sp. 669A]MBO1308180.1 prenyltransferase [Enterococcus sp. 669A]
MDYQKDIETILSHRYDQKWDYWTTEDRRLTNGGAFSCIASANYLLELGVSPQDPVLQKVAELLWDAWKETGEFKLYPKGPSFPCQTIPAATLLIRLGYLEDERMQITLQYLLDSRYSDGGWWCKKFYFGKGPETEHSNPLPTLNALNLFRYTEHFNDLSLNQAIDFLLRHWETKAPIGPCHYGIGTLFMQVEYPLMDYNLFHYVYVLSFYDYARKDPRFLDAFQSLKERTVNEQIVVERVNRKLAKLEFCKKGQVSELATKKYQEILRNICD